MDDLKDKLKENLTYVIDLLRQERNYEAYAYLIGMRSVISSMKSSEMELLKEEKKKLKKKEKSLMDREKKALDLEKQAKKKYLEALVKEKEVKKKEECTYKIPKTPTPHKNKSKKLDDFLDRQDANRNHWGQ